MPNMLKKRFITLLLFFVGCCVCSTGLHAQINLEREISNYESKYRIASAERNIVELKNIKKSANKLYGLSLGPEHKKRVDALVGKCEKEIQHIDKEKKEKEKREKELLEQQRKEAEEAKRKAEEQKAREAYEAERQRTAHMVEEANGVKFTMIRVDKGEFSMGSLKKDEQKKLTVRFGYEYYMGETEVTQELWEAVMGENPSEFKGKQLPVENVSWNDCQTFIKKLNQITGKTFRLPTEQEWEYAAREGNQQSNWFFSGSDNCSEVAWYNDNSNFSTQPVKSKHPNAIGLYDMSGNVCEWCLNVYEDQLPSGTTIDAKVYEGNGDMRSIRGGSWNDYQKPQCVIMRSAFYAEDSDYVIGLRLVLSIP